MSKRHPSTLLAAAWLVLAAPGCVQVEGVPEGALAVVGNRVIEKEDLARVQTQLGAYAQRRFHGPEGERAMLEGMVQSELLAQEAIAAGLGQDPRVAWTLHEELAAIQLAAEMERRVPYDEVAQDEAALQAYLDAHRDRFTVPEKRKLQATMFRQWAQAEAALAKLKSGESRLEDFGQVVATPAQVRDDVNFPAFHPLLFEPALKTGDWLARPVIVGDTLLVGRLLRIEPPQPMGLDDPKVREQVVNAVRAPRVEAATRAYLAELAAQYPTQGS